MNLKQIYDKAVKIAEALLGTEPDRIGINEDGTVCAIWTDFDERINRERDVPQSWLDMSMPELEQELDYIKERRILEAEQRKQQQIEAEKQREISLYNQLKQKYEQQ